MTKEQIELAARIRKVIHLTSIPGMDDVAVKLNSGLTWDEKETAKRWALAFELAEKGGNLYELVHEYKKRLKE